MDYRNRLLTWHGQKFPLCTEKTAKSKLYGFDSSLPAIGHKAIQRVVEANANVFSNKTEPTGDCPLIPMRIITTGPPIAQKAYRLPLTKRKIVDEEIDSMLANGIIEPSTSQYASPITLVPKKDGTTRFCVDYRKLNADTVKDQYPLPQIADIFDQLGGSTIFSTIDLKTGYWQIPMHPNDAHKTAFRCHRGLFQFRRMPFGLCNAPASFQRIMDQVLQGLVCVCVFVYLDDIVVFSKNPKDHAHHLQLVFDRLKAAGLKMKPSKCSFGLPEIKLLGYIINRQGITTDPEKVKAIVKLQPPQTVKEVVFLAWPDTIDHVSLTMQHMLNL